MQGLEALCIFRKMTRAVDYEHGATCRRALLIQNVDAWRKL